MVMFFHGLVVISHGLGVQDNQEIKYVMMTIRKLNMS